MATYEDEHDIPHPAPSTSNPTSASDSPYAARPAPRTFAEFLAEVNRIAAAATGLTDQTGTAEQGGERNVNGEERVEPDAGGIMVDEDLYEEIFGGEDGIGRNAYGASEEAIDGLQRVTESDILSSFKGTTGESDPDPFYITQGNDLNSFMLFVYQPVLFVRSISNDLSTESPFTSTCPICLLTLSNILTEQEYAEATDHYVGDEKELGLRRLPCGQGGSGAGAGGEEGKVKGGHVICGKCARKWLRLNNTCPLCRSVVDTSLPTNDNDPNSAAAYTTRMLSLFRATFGQGQEFGTGGSGDGDGTNEVMNDHLAGMFGIRGGPFAGRNGNRRPSDEALSGMYM